MSNGDGEGMKGNMEESEGVKNRKGVVPGKGRGEGDACEGERGGEIKVCGSRACSKVSGMEGGGRKGDMEKERRHGKGKRKVTM